MPLFCVPVSVPVPIERPVPWLPPVSSVAGSPWPVTCCNQTWQSVDVAFDQVIVMTDEVVS